MLSTDEIRQFIEEDRTSEIKRFARKGQAYYEAEHDIKDYKLYYYNADGKYVEDDTRSNIKIAHPFFTELTDQAVQYILSVKDGFIKSDIPELQSELDEYFNENDDFIEELSELLTGVQTKGFDYMYAYKNADNKTSFQWADSLGVVEVREKDTDDGCEYLIYWYVDRVDKGQKLIKRIQVWDKEQAYFYVQTDDGKIEVDEDKEENPRPHILLKKEGTETIYQSNYGLIPFFRMDNNKKQQSSLKPIKPLIDDYDLMACGLSNNIQDANEYLVVVSGFDGDDINKVITNTKTKKHIGVGEGGGVDFKTVDIPYEARKIKLELDEKNIYKFGFGLNTAALKDTNATTNIAIKAAYSLLELKCSKIRIRLKGFLRKLIKVVLKEINEINKTDYQMKDVYFNLDNPEVMSNAEENARIKLTEAQIRQAEINIVLGLAGMLDNETIMQLICEQLELDWEELKDKVPDPDEAENQLNNALNTLGGVVPEGDAVNE